jgi:hypothetical protein
MDKWDGILAALAIIFSLALVIGAGMFQATPSKMKVNGTYNVQYAIYPNNYEKQIIGFT